MNRRVRFRLIAGLATLGAVAACVIDPLNPQPLPPGPPENGASFGADAAGPQTFDARAPADSGNRDTRDDDGGNPPPGVPAIDGGDAGSADADADDAD